ncbi:LacI family DNA-binding transcriptional regulator [Butyricicoccus sp. Marseille-Q5471]|uniref:LacI family DNA-binding transcriptional regulator n=1 Tax=Butyricicoccus sp. Marseille-Q5471 TaxID=3039493 RepID=UPI0024BBF516|nr:LacI family DNA-binding transcriptional regulator [Butyricicoccus sp. Marseille-Q5471]
MKVTAQWIADQCGVSRGTVDRVVNGRGNVAPEVRERIQKVISECSYRTPAQKQAERAGRGAYRIGFIMPSWDAFFIRRMREGIRTAVQHRGVNDAVVLIEELKNRSSRAYFEAISRLEAREIDGLAIAGPDTMQMAEELDRLIASGIAVVTCNSDVPNSQRLYHVGQDLIRSGRIAAGLLAPYVGDGGEVLVVTGNREFTAHSMRVRGFLDRLHEMFGVRVPSNVIECIEQYDLTYDGVLEQLRRNSHIRGIYMATESVRGCMDALERAKPAKHIHVVCHDATPHARQYLAAGRLDFVIDQDFAAQATRAVEVLAHALRTGETPKQTIEYIHTSIITRELL